MAWHSEAIRSISQGSTVVVVPVVVVVVLVLVVLTTFRFGFLVVAKVFSI
jgi:hypothetical protein